MRIPLAVVDTTSMADAPERAIGKGNEKLGRRVGTFSLPSVHTCHLGSTPTCRSLCYADSPQSHFSMPATQRRYWTNLAFTRDHRFVPEMIGRIAGKKLVAFRWHVSGDLYSAGYAAKVLAVMSATPEAPAYIYTRAWRDAGVRAVLATMAALPHVQVWLSCDRDSGPPAAVPGTRRAYLQTLPGDEPGYPVDLVFRDRPARRTVAKRVAGALVCPVENGVSHSVTCDRCRVCFSDPVTDPARRTRRDAA
jgi:hypothetical protein